MADLGWALICKNIQHNDAGEVVITEPFSYILSNKFPTEPRTFYVVSLWSGKAGERFNMRINIVNPSAGESLVSNNENFSINYKTARVDDMYSEIIFPNPGDYRVEFFINDLLIHTSILSLIQE